MNQGTTGSPTSSPVLEDLHSNLQVQNGVLTVYVPRNDNVEQVEQVASTEPLNANTQPLNNNWSSIVTKNVFSTEASSSEHAQIVFIDDGSPTLKPPKNFLTNARKLWDSSIIGHFIGGSFEFKFVWEQAFKMWKNMGLTRVFYSSKGYYTFKFATINDKNEVLSLHSVQMGGKTLYLFPWMEANKFKRNVIESVPVWIKMEDVPHSYWSREGLTHISKAIGPH